MSRPLRALAILVLAAIPACCTPVLKVPDRPAIDRGGAPPPAHAEIAERYNQRVARLDRAYAFITLMLWFTDDQGQEQYESLDGTFQYIRPSKLLVEFRKLSETYAFLGSNEREFWWIELGEQRRALRGRHEGHALDRVAEIGVPVHPLDLIQLVALVPVPIEGSQQSRWSDDGRAVVLAFETHSGTARTWINPDTLLAERVELAGSDGRRIVARIPEYAPVDISGELDDPLMPREAVIEFPGGSLRAKITFADARASSILPRNDSRYDPDWLISRYRVQHVEDLSAPPEDRTSEGTR